MKVRKAVIPAAGLGTRFLPATKSVPKEMLPVVDKPTIQYVVEAAAGAGIGDILMVSGRSKRSIENHFDRAFELEFRLEQTGKYDELKEIRQISDLAQIHFVRQPEPLGLGNAVAMAEAHVAGEPFAVLLGDEILPNSTLLRDMIDTHERLGTSVIAVMEVPPSEIPLYGVIRPESVEDGVAHVLEIVEKPSVEEAPSNLAVIFGYVLTPDIFDALRQTPPEPQGEIQLTYALNLLAERGVVHAQVFDGKRFDIGNKLDYLRATVELALGREDMGEAFRSFLADLVRREGIVEG
jgi:UTP--glucose-1-phosphate uridylyltransferase